MAFDSAGLTNVLLASIVMLNLVVMAVVYRILQKT